MKKLHLYGITPFLIAASAILLSCIPPNNIIPVKGSGPAIEKDYEVSDFSSIDVSGGFDVILVQGNSEGVTLTAQENLFEYIHVEVSGNTLKIYTDNNIMSTRPMKARISFKNMDHLEVSGGGDVSAETTIDVPRLNLRLSGGGDIRGVINASDMECRISGGGDARIDGKYDTFSIHMSGGGDISSSLSTGALSCRVSGGGDVVLRSEGETKDTDLEISGGGDMDISLNAERVRCSVSGGGDATLTGHASQIDIILHGGGDMRASSLTADIVTFEVSGGSDLHVQALKELRGHISGGGDLYYSGGAEKVNVDTRGGSEVHRN